MKRTIKQVLHDRLVETGILPELAAMEEEEDVSPDMGLGAVSDRALPNVEHVDPALAIKMKELDLQIKQEERETLLKLRLIEAETDQAFRLQQLKEQDLKNRPVPRARSQPPSVTGEVTAAPNPVHMRLVQMLILMQVRISNLFHPSERVRQMYISSHLNA